MRYIPEIFLLLVTTTAALTGENIDVNTLKACKHSEECHPWQVCATCTAPILWGIFGAHLTKRWCSDVSDTGICEYNDGNLSCSCDEDEENDPKRLALLDLGSGVPERFCKDDATCRKSKPNSRCSHCAYTSTRKDLQVVINACTSPPEDPNSYCHSSQLFMCSCGQRLPAPVNLEPAAPQTKNPEQQQVITVANPPDLTRAETVDLSAWPKQAVLGDGSVAADGLPSAEVFASSSWTQDIAGPATGGEGNDVWNGDGYDSFST